MIDMSPVVAPVRMTRGDRFEPITLSIEIDGVPWVPTGGVAQVRQRQSRSSLLIVDLGVTVNGLDVVVGGTRPQVDDEGSFWWDVELWDNTRRLTYVHGSFTVGWDVSQGVGP